MASTDGPVSILFNTWFVDVDEPRERVHIYHQSIDELDAEMSVAEFFRYADEVRS